MTYEIRDDVPLPAPRPSLRGAILALDVGQSVLVPSSHTFRSVKSTASFIATRWSRKFEIREADDKTGTWVWRVEKNGSGSKGTPDGPQAQDQAD
jgi:hypothetical protein